MEGGRGGGGGWRGVEGGGGGNTGNSQFPEKKMSVSTIAVTLCRGLAMRKQKPTERLSNNQKAIQPSVFCLPTNKNWNITDMPKHGPHSVPFSFASSRCCRVSISEPFSKSTI